MMMDDLKAWLETFGLDLTVFCDFRPDEPAEVIVVREYGGNQVRGLDAHRRAVQFLFRAADYETAHDAAWSVYRSLVPTPPVIESGDRKLTISPNQSPIFMERDSATRSVFVFNAVVNTAPDQ